MMFVLEVPNTYLRSIYHSQSEQSFSSLLYQYLMPGLRLAQASSCRYYTSTNQNNFGTPGLEIGNQGSDE